MVLVPARTDRISGLGDTVDQTGATIKDVKLRVRAGQRTLIGEIDVRLDLHTFQFRFISAFGFASLKSATWTWRLN